MSAHDNVHMPRQVRNHTYQAYGFASDSRGRIVKSYMNYMDKLLESMVELVNKGHKIVWGKTRNWCTINGIVFNVAKDVYDRRVINGKVFYPSY